MLAVIVHYRLVTDFDRDVPVCRDARRTEPHGRGSRGKELAMRICTLLMSAAALGALAMTTSAATGATGAPVKKQRIVIEGTFNIGTSKGTFKLIPLTPGPLKQDSGTFTGTGAFEPAVIRNGQRVTPVIGSDRLTGKNGSFTVGQRLEIVAAGGPVAAGGRYSVVTGTWSLSGGTGSYAGLAASGGYAAVAFPRVGNVRFSEEGIVRAS
jgi:hypothetical protein